MHFIEIDQSGRTEKLNEPSVIAFANGIQASILIPTKEKREIYAVLNARFKKLHDIHLRIFVAAVFFVLKDHLKTLGHITIDREFDGRDGDLKGFLLLHIRKIVPGFPKEGISIQSIGKKSPAHDLAHKVFLGLQKADYTLKASDLLPIV